MNVTITKAAKMANVSRNTIYKDIESGMLSVSTNGRGKTLINVSELQRVYDNLDVEAKETKAKTFPNAQKSPERPVGGQTEQVAVLQERIESHKKQEILFERLISEQNRKHEEISERLEEQIQMQSDQIKSFQNLLEDQSKNPAKTKDWETSIKSLEDRIANQEKAAKEKAEKEAEEKNEFQKKLDEQAKLLEEKEEALELEKHKSFIHRMLGK